MLIKRAGSMLPTNFPTLHVGTPSYVHGMLPTPLVKKTYIVLSSFLISIFFEVCLIYCESTLRLGKYGA